ncbi:MAG: hypothetical protein FJZ90_07095 [Chloroflexi bacterium]|nr:hypothetical protein [Chloroflexota bacterium]
MLDLDWATLLFQIANFVVLLVILNKFLFAPLRRKLDERGRVVSEILQRARDQEAEAAELRAQWEQRLHRIAQEKEELILAAQLEAAQKAEELLQEARARIDRLTAEMMSDLDRQRNETVVRHYDGILDTIISLSGSVVQSVTTRRTHDDLVTNFAAGIYQLPQTDVQEYRRLMRGRTPVAFVSTPVALTPEQTQTLADTLSSLVDRHMELQVNVDPSLIAGLQVRVADKLIDNSVRHQLARIRDRVRVDLVSRVGANT